MQGLKLGRREEMDEEKWERSCGKKKRKGGKKGKKKGRKEGRKIVFDIAEKKKKE